MTLWNSTDLQKALNANVPAGINAQRIVIDSRQVQAGDIYVALKGERVDGHDFIADAFARGAVAAIAEHGEDPRVIHVSNTYTALEQLGAYARARFAGKVVGLTGSVGKTTTKEMIALALSAYGKTYATTGNLNNHIGVPLTLANLPADAAFAVIEMGMNHAGEIAALTKQTKPDVALITTVDAVHLEFFDSIEGIAEAKAEIFQGLQGLRIAILNTDNAYTPLCEKRAQEHGAARILKVGKQQGDVHMLHMETTPESMKLTLSCGGKTLELQLSAMGEAVLRASMMAVATVLALGLEPTTACKALASFKEVDGRGALNKNGEFYLLDDAYNASPASMKAAFEKTTMLRRMHADIKRVVAVLGDMLELGPSEIPLHLSLIPALEAAGIDIVHTAGSRMEHVHNALKPAMRGQHAPDAKTLGEQLPALIQSGDLVLLKGSHGSYVYKLVDVLKGL